MSVYTPPLSRATKNPILSKKRRERTTQPNYKTGKYTQEAVKNRSRWALAKTLEKVPGLAEHAWSVASSISDAGNATHLQLLDTLTIGLDEEMLDSVFAGLGFELNLDFTLKELQKKVRAKYAEWESLVSARRLPIKSLAKKLAIVKAVGDLAGLLTSIVTADLYRGRIVKPVYFFNHFRAKNGGPKPIYEQKHWKKFLALLAVLETIGIAGNRKACRWYLYSVFMARKTPRSDFVPLNVITSPKSVLYFLTALAGEYNKAAVAAKSRESRKGLVQSIMEEAKLDTDDVYSLMMSQNKLPILAFTPMRRILDNVSRGVVPILKGADNRFAEELRVYIRRDTTDGELVYLSRRPLWRRLHELGFFKAVGMPKLHRRMTKVIAVSSLEVMRDMVDKVCSVVDFDWKLLDACYGGLEDCIPKNPEDLFVPMFPIKNRRLLDETLNKLRSKVNA